MAQKRVRADGDTPCVFVEQFSKKLCVVANHVIFGAAPKDTNGSADDRSDVNSPRISARRDFDNDQNWGWFSVLDDNTTAVPNAELDKDMLLYLPNA
eukprot:scaffold1355_cov268-Pinguiococcus_pyrenoidosus.AAC.42